MSDDKNKKKKGAGKKNPQPRKRQPKKQDVEALNVNETNDAPSDEWKELMTRWVNNMPERERPSVVLPCPPYLDRTIKDRELFMRRAKPQITKDILKKIIRGDADIFRNVWVAINKFCDVWVPSQPAWLPNGMFGDIEVPIDVEEPSWWPGRDTPGGGGGGMEAGEDDADIVYMPISYEEFLELLQLLFDLPFLMATDMDKMLVYTIKKRGLKKQGPTARLDRLATARARIERFRAAINTRPEDYPNLSPDRIPTPVEFPFEKVDRRYQRVEEKWEPDSKAVVFFELDVSGSMGGEPMMIAKFFFLLNLMWLRTKYKEVAVVFIAHNHAAYRIPSEADFFRVVEDGGTAFAPSHELVMQIERSEFFGPGWNKYCLHASDGYGEPASYVTPLIEKMIRTGFRYFGYLEIDPYGYGSRYNSSGMEAALSVAPDVKPHVGIARISSMDQVPEAMKQIMTKDKTTN